MPTPLTPMNSTTLGCGGEVQSRVPHGHLLRQDVPQRGLHRLLVLELLLPDPLRSFSTASRAVSMPQVRQDQRLLQLLEKGLVRLREAREEIRGDFFQFVKKAHSTRPFALFFLFPGSFAP